MNRPEPALSADGTLSRRTFIAHSAALAGSVASGVVGGLLPGIGGDAPAWGQEAEQSAEGAERVAFFLVADTHYRAENTAPGKMDVRSTEVTRQFIATLNALPGESIPAAAGGGVVAKPRGVIHGGDLIDTGDKNDRDAKEMQKTEWAAFQEDFGLTGSDGRLQYPVYEVHGNHDSPRGEGLVIDGICDRNRKRPGVNHVSANGLHYSWDWGGIHFINLGIVVGQVKQVTQTRRYNPRESLDFLIADLRDHVKPGQGVIITHHVDVARYTGPCDPEAAANATKEWNPCDVRGYYDALRNSNVLAILYGHTHARNVFRWDGQSAKADQGVTVFNVDNGSHFNDDRQAFFYFEVTPRKLIVRECATLNRWKTHQWTPQVWQRG